MVIFNSSFFSKLDKKINLRLGTIKKYFIVLLLFPLVSFAQLHLNIDRTQISIEEAFELSVSSNSATSGDIDISSLKQEFEILDQYKQSRVQIINGNISQSTTWTYTLLAKHSGKIIIPAISVGNESTKPIEITVKEISAQGKNTRNIIVEAEIEQSSVYVQQQFIYRQRLLFSKPFSTDSTLSTPHLTKGKAEIEPLGNSPESIVKRNGQDYRMITRRFAIIPQQSGELIFAPTVFSGTMPRSNPRNFNNFGFNPNSKRVRVRSNEVSIMIKPQPSEFTGKDWIIAKDFSLHLNWSTPPDQIKAGEPVTIVLAAIANGLHAEQLPEINLQAPKGIKLYPEKPEFNNERTLEGIIGTMNKSVVLVSSTGGEFEIPALNIPWWNSKTDQQEIAKLAAIKLKISGAAPAIKTSSQQEMNQPKIKVLKKESKQEDSAKFSVTMRILLILFFLLLVLITLGFFLKWKNKRNNNKNNSFARQKQILAALKQACLHNNSKKAQEYLQQWIHSLNQSPPSFMQETDTYLQEQIQELHHVLYAKTNKPWQGQELWFAIKKYQQSLKLNKITDKNNPQKTQVLEPLYPHFKY